MSAAPKRVPMKAVAAYDVSCPHCGRRSLWRDDTARQLANKPVYCARCGEPFVPVGA